MRDESLHCEGMVKLYHAFNAETGAVTKAVADDIVDCCKTVVGLEDRFIDLAFEAGEVQGMTPDDIKAYIRFIADWRLRQLSLPDGLWREGKSPALAAEPAVGRRARQLLRGPRPPNTPRPPPAGPGTGEAGVWGGLRRDDGQAGGGGHSLTRSRAADGALRC